MSGRTGQRHIIVRGEVQGVFFRDSLRQRAEAAGVTGWVRNREDGSVEAVLEGDSGDVEQLLEFARVGPSRAQVRQVEVSERRPEGLTGFEVR